MEGETPTEKIPGQNITTGAYFVLIALWKPRPPTTSLGRIESNFKGSRGLPLFCYKLANMLTGVFGSNFPPENP